MPIGNTVRRIFSRRQCAVSALLHPVFNHRENLPGADRSLFDRLRRPSRYAQIGLACAVLTNAVITGMDQFGTHYLVSTATAAIAVTPFAFLLHCHHTYRIAPSLTGLARFCAGIALGSALTFVSMVVLCDGLGLSATAAAPITTVVLFFWNYLATRWALLRNTASAVDA